MRSVLLKNYVKSEHINSIDTLFWNKVSNNFFTARCQIYTKMIRNWSRLFTTSLFLFFIRSKNNNKKVQGILYRVQFNWQSMFMLKFDFLFNYLFCLCFNSIFARCNWLQLQQLSTSFDGVQQYYNDFITISCSKCQKLHTGIL